MKNFKIYQLFAILLAFAPSLVFAQAPGNICLGTDVTVCLGTPVTIENCGGGTPGGTNSILLDNPTYVNLTDDSYSGVVPIGFSFNFYGNNYNQCVIGSNGVITFDLTEANGYCPWALGGVGTLPNPGFDDGLNAIMPAYSDMNPSAFASPNGEIFYQTMGTAPNRRMIIVYKDINAFGPAGFCTYMGIILNETSNSFECHLANKTISPTWNGGLAIQGSQNAPGTIAHITPGRNNTQWAAFQEAKIWTPDSPVATNNYTISNIPYWMLLSPNSTYEWENTLGQTFPYNNGVLVVASPPPGTTGYFLSVSSASCNNSVGAASDTTFITTTSSAVSASMTPDICSAGLGTVTANPLAGIPPYSYVWPTLGGATTQTVNGVFAGTYQVLMTDGLGCTSSANITVTDTPAAFQGTTTLVSCPGGNDGTAFAEMVPVLGNITYQWDDPMMQTTQTATGLAAGNYSCTITSDIGCTGVVNLVVSEIPGMIGAISAQTDVTCNSSNNGMIEVTIVQGTAPYTYSWDNSSSTTNIANDLYVGPQTVTVTDFNGCVITVSGILNEPQSLSIDVLTPDTQICPEDDITLSVAGSGGSSAYTFTWFENGTQIGTGTQITVDPEITNTQYCVELSELCGSPTDQKCMTVTFPTPIEPRAIADEYEKCVPDTFYFQNTSTNGVEIATTFWEFGDFDSHNAIVNGNDSTSHYYDQTGFQTIIMTATSIYGCVYTDTLENFIEVLPSPTADFNFSDNPATIFETTIYMQDKSSVDVIDWQWTSPYSNPAYSSSSDPVFVFPEETGVYPITLVVTTERGCVDTVTYQMNIVDDILFFAPNTFTPDGDEFNQYWKPEIQGIDIYGYELLIFNRWGQLIWENHDPSIGWDGTFNGKIVQAGAYAWTAKVKSPYNDDKKVFTGSVSIIK